jgi:pimeloyl-ACP methyl ester carboxylesterase
VRAETRVLRVQARTCSTKLWRGGQGKALVLLQGGMADAELHWSPVWDVLAKTFDVIAPDIPGFGGSNPIRRPDWRGLSTWLEILLGDLGIANATVIGNSFGGSLARAFATLVPGCASGLVCVNGGPFIPVPGWMKIVLRSPIGDLYWRRRTRGSFTEANLKRMMANESLLDAALMQRMLARHEALYPVLRACLSGFVPTASPNCRALILWGAADRHSPLAFAQALEKQIPGSRIVTIPDAGHLPQLEKPDAFVAAIQEFVG